MKRTDDLEMVKKDGFSIRKMENPSKEVIAAAITQNPYSIKFVSNANMDICKLALRLEPDVIQFIPQTEELCKYAIDLCGGAIRHIKRPSMGLYEYALRKYPGAALYIPEDVKAKIFRKWKTEGVR